MGKKVLLCVLIFAVVSFVAFCFFNAFVMFTSDTLSLTYARSATVMSTSKQFYVHDNILYFVDDHSDTIKYVKNNIIYKFAKLPTNCRDFIILEDGTALVHKNDSAICLLDKDDGTLTELWQGRCVGYVGEWLYFTCGNTLYKAVVGENAPTEVISFDELLASYSDAIVYKDSGNIYQLYLDRTDDPLMLTAGEIPWPDRQSNFLLDDPYLYTENYALHISTYTVDMYVYSTGEMKRIYDAGDPDGIIITSLAAENDRIYVSRRLTDSHLWPIADKNNINGTYEYDIKSDVWTKINGQSYNALFRFDTEALYGYKDAILFGGAKRIKMTRE